MDAASLTQEALARLADARAREALERAEVIFDEAVRTWTASHGTMRGHRVRVRVDAHTLGALRAHPGSEDAMQAAFARAIATSPDGSLAEFNVEWSGAVATVTTTYRGEVRRAGMVALGEAVCAYLEGAGEREAARLARHLHVREASPGEVVIDRDPGAWTSTAVKGALRALVGERTRVLFLTSS